ncbi:hypothetical protein FACS1894217_11370 [Clostridia bacterium]|nr:hypothetical protein FACS1894217_11370 [Clostridia bacterium]
MRAIARLAPEYAFVLHDQCVNKETGELKKPHYHYYVRYLNPRSLSGVAKEFGIPENMVEVVHSRKQTLAYLLHRTTKAVEDGKFQYPLTTLETNIEFDFDTVSSAEGIDYFKTFKEADDIDALFKSLHAQGEMIDSISKFASTLRAWKDLKGLYNYENFV